MSKDKLKWAAFGLVLGIIGGGIGNAAADKWFPGVTRFETIQAQEIRIVNGGILTISDENGNPVVVLASDRDGGGLAVRNSEGKTAAVVAAGPDGGRLIVQNAAGNQVARLYVDSDDGAGRLEILDRSGMLLAMVGEVLGAGQMEIYKTSAGGKSGEKVLAILGKFIDGGAVSFRDLQGKNTAIVGTDRLGGLIRLWDKDGKRVFERP